MLTKYIKKRFLRRLWDIGFAVFIDAEVGMWISRQISAFNLRWVIAKLYDSIYWYVFTLRSRSRCKVELLWGRCQKYFKISFIEIRYPKTISINNSLDFILQELIQLTYFRGVALNLSDHVSRLTMPSPKPKMAIFVMHVWTCTDFWC